MIYEVPGFSFDKILDSRIKCWPSPGFRAREEQKIENLTFLCSGIYILHL